MHLVWLFAPSALVLLVACGTSGVSSTTTNRAGVSEGSQPQAVATPGGASGTAAKPAADATLPAATAPEGSRVQRSARIALQVPDSGFDRALNGAIAAVEQAGGYVAGEQAEAPEDGQPLRSGQATFQVPATRLDSVVTAIRKLGTAQSISLQGNDVSQQYVDLQARLRNAEAQRDAILALMQQAKSVSDTIQIQNQLGQVTSQIEQLKGQIDYLEHSTTYASLAVAIREGAADEWGLQRASTQALHNVVGVLAFLILAVGTLIPVLVAGVPLFLVGRVVWRRMGPRSPRRPAASSAGE